MSGRDVSVFRRPGAEEWRRLILEQERGEETQREFCASRGLAPRTFQYWRRKLRSVPGSGSPAFVELTEGVPFGGSWDVELSLGDGVVLRVRRRGC